MSTRLQVASSGALQRIDNADLSSKSLVGHRYYVKKIVESTTLASVDSGSVCLVNPAAATVITLPSMAVSLRGWNTTIVITEDTTASAGGMNAVVSVAFGQGDNVGKVQDATGTGSNFPATGDTHFVFTADATPGDSLHCWTDGTRWYVEASVRALASGDFSGGAGSIS